MSASLLEAAEHVAFSQYVPAGIVVFLSSPERWRLGSEPWSTVFTRRSLSQTSRLRFVCSEQYRERQKDSKSLLCDQLESSASGSYPSLSTAPAISLRSSSAKPLDDYHCYRDCCGEPAYCVL
ncbi:hypothetical protein T07_15222 [Trichinella nelsoni]|uniref:Uncharacterized protein n=1 Tax=Trichinella nelsoni TaxID=6336 RepID=A0A0V0RKM4_9BILA|nr:hypothetical protein T07_15222 [Trichinella nelsoni]